MKHWVEFKTIQEAMDFCDKLEVASLGEYIYRPTMENFNCFRVVSVNKSTKIIQAMTIAEYCGFCRTYEL